MKKYKISENRINEFWGWFTKKRKPESLQTIIDNDPVLKQLDKEFRDLTDEQIPILLRMKKRNPRVFQMLVDKGLVPADLK